MHASSAVLQAVSVAHARMRCAHSCMAHILKTQHSRQDPLLVREVQLHLWRSMLFMYAKVPAKWEF